MKLYKLNFLTLFLVFTLNFLFAQQGDVLLTINGHDHSLPLLLKEEVKKAYNEAKDTVIDSMIGETLDGTGVDILFVNDCEVMSLILNSDISTVEYSKISDTKLKVVVGINNNKVKLKTKIDYPWWVPLLDYIYRFWANFKMDLVFEVDVKIENTKILYAVTSADVEAKITSINSSKDNLMTPAEIFINWLAIAIHSHFSPDHGETLSDFVDKEYNVINLSNHSGALVAGADPEIELEAIRKSLPLDIVLGDMSNSSTLKLEMDLLHGYYQDNGSFNNSFANYTPSKQNILQYAGFSYLHWGKFDQIKKEDSNLSMFERVDTLVQRMQAMDLNQLRIEAMWNKIVPSIDNIDPSLDPDDITNDMVDAYVQQIDSAGGWDSLTQIIDIVKANNFIMHPVLVIGSGLETRPPMYQDSVIAPGTLIRGSFEAGEPRYKAIPENVYLYWLKLYARAVVNKYSDFIVNWQAETELNAARFTESYDDWWRKGNAWADDSADGFQTDVARTLYEAVEYEAHTRLGHEFKVIQQFHIFNLAKRLVEWKNYYDIVGLNVYPHLLHAWPVAGFMPGEFVWAARRILKYLDTENKKVWVLETGYAANTNDPNPDDTEEDIMHFSYDRQAQYIKEALLGCAANGAEAFNWFLMETNETDEEDIEIEHSNNYIGFYDLSGNRKNEGYNAYKNTFADLRTGEDITLSNKYDTELLEGTFTISGSMNGIQSGDTVKVNMNEDINLCTNSKYLPLPSTSNLDTLQHQNWNSIPKDCFQDHMINLSHGGSYDQIAKFNYTYPLFFELNVANHTTDDQIKNIRIRDPWVMDAIGQYPNKLSPLSAYSDSLTYNVFKEMPPVATDTLVPYYSIRPPEVVYFEEDLAVFDDWTVIQDASLDDDPRASGDIFQKAVVVTGDNPRVRANYLSNIKTEYSNIVFQNGQFELSCNQVVTYADGIYEFVEWKSYEPDGETENSSLVDFSPYDYHNSVVTINYANVVIKPIYQKVSNIEDYPITLQPDQIFYLPENIQLNLAANFLVSTYYSTGNNVIPPSFHLQGSLGKEIVLAREPVSPYYETGLFDIAYDSYYNLPFHTILCHMEYVHFKRFSTACYLDPLVNFYTTSNGNLNKGASVTENYYPQLFYMKNCTFSENDSALGINCSGETKQSIVNTTFYKNKINIKKGKTSFFNCIFYETEFANTAGIRKINNCLFYKVPDSLALMALGTGNINDNPRFIDAVNGNFYLKYSSPCLDSGTPDFPDHLGHIVSHTDIDGSVPDIGAYSYLQLSDTIKTNTTISGECRIIGDLVVADNVELTFKPGTKIKLAPDVDIIVNGKLTAKGTSDNKITFTSTADDPTEDDYWSRIYFPDNADDNSIIEHCKIEYAYNGVWLYCANVDVLSSEISHVYNKAIYARNNLAYYSNNYIHDCGYGMWFLYCNDYGISVIQNNHIENTNKAIFLYRASPDLVDNEFNNNDYGVYCVSHSSPRFGTYSVYGNNNFHDNGYSVYASSSNPFLGREYCDINGGYNIIENSTSYHIYTKYNSFVIAEENWWGSYPPNSSKFYNSSGCVIDINPPLEYLPLESFPLFKHSSLSKTTGGDESAFNAVFSTTDSSLTEEEVMSNYDVAWPILQRLLYARNLIKLGFPNNASEISNNILKVYPDSAEAYFALDLLWQSGRGYTPEFEDYKVYLDSLTNSELQKEVYEEAELLLEDYEEDGLAKKVNTYQKYKFPNIAANSLFRDIIHYLGDDDMEAARASFSIMENNYPKAPATDEARLLLNELEGMAKNDPVKIPEEYVLLSNYPNPFNPITNIRFGIPAASNIEITIFNILGQKVKTITKTALDPGFHKVIWKGTNSNNTPLASGLYVYRFKAMSAKDNTEKFTKTGKLLLLK